MTLCKNVSGSDDDHRMCCLYYLLGLYVAPTL